MGEYKVVSCTCCRYTDPFLLEGSLMKEVEGTLKDQPHKMQCQSVPKKKIRTLNFLPTTFSVLLSPEGFCQ